MSGIYTDNPRRATTRPTAERMLKNFSHIKLTTIYVAVKLVFRHLTPLTLTQKEILDLLQLPASLYTDLAQVPPLFLTELLSSFINRQLWHSEPIHSLAL